MDYSTSDEVTPTASLITRSEQYQHAKQLIESAKSRLLVVERTPVLLEKDIDRIKASFHAAMIHAIEKAVTTDFTMLHLISREETRTELQFADGGSRNFAVKQIYGLKSQQNVSGNRFRFDFVDHNSALPLIVSDETLVYWNAGQTNVIVETRIRDKTLSDIFFTSYAKANITSDSEMAALLDIQYDDRDKVIVVDTEDNFLGVLASVVAHAKGMLHRGIFIEVLCSDGKVLISKRSPYKSIEPAKWDFAVSGHCEPSDLEPGSNTMDFYVNCALRELKEELDITLSRDALHIQKKVYLNTKSGENVIVQIFQVKANEDVLRSIKPSDEVTETKRVTREELSVMAKQGQLTDWSAEIVREKDLPSGV